MSDYNLADTERRLCQEALERAGSIVGAARLLGITRHALTRRIAKFHIGWRPRDQSSPCPGHALATGARFAQDFAVMGRRRRPSSPPRGTPCPHPQMLAQCPPVLMKWALEVMMSRTVVLVFAAVLSSCRDEPEEFFGAADPRAWVDTSMTWDSPIIPVCWENPTPKDEAERFIIQTTIEGTWDLVSQVDFVGWGTCAEDSKGIRILIKDDADGAFTLGLGKNLDGVKGGMHLNVRYKKWNSICDRKDARLDCVREDAMHEFGHALGFAHEQARPDTPDWCMEKQEGGEQAFGDAIFGDWDEASIMNYCRSEELGPVLSATDILAVQAVYGAAENPPAPKCPVFQCTGYEEDTYCLAKCDGTWYPIGHSFNIEFGQCEPLGHDFCESKGLGESEGACWSKSADF